MPAQRRLKPSERQQIIGARLSRVPLIEISNRTNIPYSTVKYTWSQYGKRDSEEHDLPRQGRPRKTSEDQDKRLYRYVRIRSDMPWSELLEETLLSRTSVRRKFKEIDPDFKKYRMRWCPYLTDFHIRIRNRYAHDYGGFRPEWWGNVWFVDECSVEIGKGLTRQWCWRHSGEQWLPENMAKSPNNHDTVMVWCAMRADGTLVWCFTDEYYKSETTVTGQVYARLLRDILPQIYQPGHVWLQDNARVHTARVAMQVLHDLSVWYLPHPARSPDLNAIEHLWWKLKELVHRIAPELRTIEGGKPARKEALKAAIRAAFDQLTADPEWDLPAILAHSMPKRLAAVKLVGGKQTKY